MIENIPVNTMIDSALDSLKSPIKYQLEETTMRPATMFANSILINCVSLIESLLRKYYIALLKIYPDSIDAILSEKMSLKNYLNKRKNYDSDIALIADLQNFQNINSVIKNFEKFNTLEIRLFLKQNDSNFYSFLNRIFSQRHEYVHEFKMNKNYKLEQIK